MRNGNANLLQIAPLTIVLLVANVIMFCLSAVMSKNFWDINSSALSALGCSQREFLWDGEWHRLVAPMFLHISLWHVFLNMRFLYYAGPDAELYFGTENYGTIYLMSGLCGVCLSQIFGGYPAAGASGSLCGILGAQLAVHILRCPRILNAWRNAEVRSLTLSILIMFLIGWLGFMNMDNWGHFGGILGGVLLGGSFHLWRERKAIGKVGVFATLILMAVLVCAARWSVFNPAYHIYKGAVAQEELKDPQAAEAHFAEARVWADHLAPLQILGTISRRKTDNVIESYQNNKWNLSSARNGTMNFVIALFGRSRND